MASVLSDSLNSGVAGVRIGENANSFKLDSIDGGFTKLNGGLNGSVMDGLGGACDKLLFEGKVKCFAEFGTILNGFKFGVPLRGPEIGKFLGANVSVNAKTGLVKE